MMLRWRRAQTFIKECWWLRRALIGCGFHTPRHSRSLRVTGIHQRTTHCEVHVATLNTTISSSHSNDQYWPTASPVNCSSSHSNDQYWPTASPVNCSSSHSNDQYWPTVSPVNRSSSHSNDQYWPTASPANCGQLISWLVFNIHNLFGLFIWLVFNGTFSTNRLYRTKYITYGHGTTQIHQRTMKQNNKPRKS